MNSASMVCPKCRVGTLQYTHVKMDYDSNDNYGAYGCNKCDYGYWVSMVPNNVVISTKGTYQENTLEDKLAKEISEMSDEEVKNNIDKNFNYWQDRKTELQRCLDNNEIFVITEEDQKQEIIFLKQERQRLIEKLEKIENLSRYAWEQVKRNPQEAEELFRMICMESK